MEQEKLPEDVLELVVGGVPKEVLEDTKAKLQAALDKNNGQLTEEELREIKAGVPVKEALAQEETHQMRV